MTDITFLGWLDPDRKKSAAAKLADAIARHEEKHGVRPNICLTSEQDEAELAGADHGIQIAGRHWLARGVFYVGVMGAAPVAQEPTYDGGSMGRLASLRDD